MPTGERYLIDAYLLRFELHESLRDVVVEGNSDVRFFKWYLAKQCLEAATYAVDDLVEVPASTVSDLGLDINAQGRAIALAVEAAKRNLLTECLTVIVDRDLLWVKGPGPVQTKHLLYTDDCALENYALAVAPLTKWLLLQVGSDRDPLPVLERARSILQRLLAIRAALHSIQCPLVADPAKCFGSDGQPPIDVAEVWRRSTGRPASVEQLKEIDDYVRKIEDSGYSGRGHDVSMVLRAMLGLKQELGQVERSLLLSLDVSDLESSMLFVELGSRLTL